MKIEASWEKMTYQQKLDEYQKKKKNNKLLETKWMNNKTKNVVTIFLISGYSTLVLLHENGKTTRKGEHYFVGDYSPIQEKREKKNLKRSGYNTHRFEQNPLEYEFAKAFDKELKYNPETMDQIVFGTNERGYANDHLTSKREEKIVLSVIQWLGSPVGQGFIQKVMESNK